ncbi:hypothetical protein DB346_07245 [Verrucomicrobia bacterium LW23]|nr:hypothetical protein DB346_07245 [Verrucomicrobia bacterium LW23]
MTSEHERHADGNAFFADLVAELGGAEEIVPMRGGEEDAPAPPEPYLPAEEESSAAFSRVPVNYAPMSLADPDDADTHIVWGAGTSSDQPDGAYEPEIGLHPVVTEEEELLRASLLGDLDLKPASATEPAPERYADSGTAKPEVASDEVVPLKISPSFAVMLRRQPNAVLCYARLGQVVRPETMQRLLAANVRMLPRQAWFTVEDSTREAIASRVVYLGERSLAKVAERVREFVEALPAWADAIAASESELPQPDDDAPPSENGVATGGLMHIRV